MNKKFILIILAVVFALGVLAFPIGSAFASDVTVNILFIYAPDCTECGNILNTDVPNWLNRYGDQITILSIDITKPGNEQIYNSLKDKYGLQNKPLPVVIVSDQVLIGADEVRAKTTELTDQSLQDGGSNFPFSSTTTTSSGNLTLLLISSCVFTLVIFGVVLGWIKTSRELKKNNLEKNKALDENSDLRKKVDNLEISKEELRDHIHELNRKMASDPVLSALIGQGNFPVDYLAEAMRILYFNDKRSSEATVRDVTGYFIGLLKMISGLTEIEAIGYYQEEVKFSSHLHTCNTPIPDGQRVKIIESGWKKEDIVLKKAIVEMVKEG